MRVVTCESTKSMKILREIPSFPRLALLQEAQKFIDFKIFISCYDTLNQDWLYERFWQRHQKAKQRRISIRNIAETLSKPKR